MVVKLRPHQQEVLQKLDYGKILYGGVGGGKTITSIAFHFEKVMGGVIGDWTSIQRPTNLYVITTAKVRDSLAWEETAIKFGISTDADKSIPGCTITVDSWNNIGKYTDVKDAFFVFDEQRLVGSGAWVKSFYKIAKANRWIILSATPGDTWLDYIPVFVANGWYKNKTEFTREHVVYAPFTKFPKVLRYTGVNKLVRYKNHVLVEMPFERHTTRVITDVPVSYDFETYNKVVKQRWHPYEERPIRDVAELFHVMRKVVNSDVSRVEAVKKLWQEHPKLIVFYNFNYELEQLRTLIPEGQLASDASILDLKRKIDSQPKPPRRASRGSSIPSQERKSGHKKDSSDPSSAETSSTSPLTSVRKADKCHTKSPNSENLLSDGSRTPSDESSTKNSTDERRTSKNASSRSTSESTSSSQDPGRVSSKSQLSPQASLSRSGDITVANSNNTPISSGSTSSVEVAEWNGHKHEPIPQTDRWLYLVQYTAGAEGWNCTSTDAMVFYSLTYSYKNFIQAQGRIDRLNTPFTKLKYFILMSSSAIDKAVHKALDNKKSFNERKYYPKEKAA